MAIETKILDNGLKTTIDSQPHLQTVTIAFGVGLGSVDENPKLNGSAHFLEHMLFKGTNERTWKDIDDQLKEIGASYNAFTDHETTIYFTQVYKDYFGKAMEILSDMIKNSTLPEKEFELERGPVINENLIRHDNTKYMISDYMPLVLYRKHPARMSIGGDNEKSIWNIRRSDLMDLYKGNYVPGNSVLSIYGAVSAKNAADCASRYFTDFDGKPRKAKRAIAREKQERCTLTIKRKGIKQTRIGIGFKSSEFRRGDAEEYLALSVIERYLGDKLFEEIREKNGLSYDPMFLYGAYSTFGFIAAAAGIEPSKLEKAKGIMLSEYQKLQDGEIDKKELERTKRTISIEGRIRKDNTAAMAMNTASYELMYGGSKLLYDFPDLIKKVTLDDVRKYSRKYIDVDKCGVVILKPE